MSNWFETIVPSDRTWSADNIRPVKTVKKGGAADIARYLSTVLERPNDPMLNGDNFTAIAVATPWLRNTSGLLRRSCSL